MAKKGRGPDPTRADTVERENNLSRLEHRLLRGMSNQYELAAAFGVSQPAICIWIKEIYERWKAQSPVDTVEARMIRVHQIDAIAVLALNEFDRSRRDNEEFTVSTRTCTRCNGEGKDEVRPNEFVDCTECHGSGKITVETVKVGGRNGDAAYLNVAKACFESAAKLQGCYPETVKFSKSSIILDDARIVGGPVQMRLEEMYYEAPVDLIIKAKATLDQLRLEVSKGNAKQVIEVQSIQKEEEDSDEQANGNDQENRE